MDTSLSKLRQRVKESKAWRAAVQAMAEWGTTEGLNNNKYSKSE